MGLPREMTRRVAVVTLMVIAAVASETSTSTMPLFAWSGHSELVKPHSADSALATAITSGDTELVMVYMLNEVSTRDMQIHKESFTNLQDTLEQAQSSSFVALPVTKVNIDSILATSRVNGVAGVDVESSQLQAYLSTHPELMTNSKPDVIVVRFPANMDAASTDALVGSAQKAVAAATSGKYNSILSTTSSMEPGLATNLAFQFFQADNLRSSVPYNGTRTSLLYGPSTYLTPTLLIAILIMIYMGFLALAAYCCILSLQTPEKFEGDQEKEMNNALNQDKS